MDRIVLGGGLVLSMDAEAASADVLIEDGRIVAVEPGLDVEDAEAYDCAGTVVLPGFVDAHRHTWQGALRGVAADLDLGEYFEAVRGEVRLTQTPEDVEIGTLIGAVDALDAGTTTLFDWCDVVNGPEHVDAAMGALSSAGIRARFGHGDPDDEPSVRRMSGDLVEPALAIPGPAYAPLEDTARHLTLGRELGLRISLHIGSGARSVGQRAVERLRDAGLLGPDLTFVHGNTTPRHELEAIAASGGGLVVTPAVECMMALGTPAFLRYAEAGGAPALGTDVPVAAGADMFAQMRCTLAIERTLSESSAPSAADVLRAATIGGARAIGMDDRIGSIAPGKRADLMVLRAPDAARHPRPSDLVVTALGPADVDAVLVDGRFVKRAGPLLEHDPAGLRARAAGALERFTARPAGVRSA